MSRPTIGALCARYLEAIPQICGTQRNILERLQREPIGQVKAPGTPRDVIKHCRIRRSTVAPATVLLDVVYLRGVLAYAKAGWELSDVTDAPIREALPILKKEGLLGTSRRRTRIPSDDETKQIVEYFR